MKAQKAHSTRNGSGRHTAAAHATFSDALVKGIDKAGDSLATYVEKAATSVRGFGDQIGSVSSAVMEKSVKAGEKVTAYVRANPGKSFAVALAAGYIVARMMRRKANAH